MAALTTKQQAFLDQLQVSFDSFVAALTAAIEVDNDPDTVLQDVFPPRAALADAVTDLGRRLGGTVGGPYQVKLPPGTFAVFEVVQRVDFATVRGPLNSGIPRE